jgi:hypothetical protein
MLNSTTYPNFSRIVSGAVILYPNDGIILCDTSTAPVTMTLQEIPANNWQTTWKLYVLDNSNNAGTFSITISAPSGYTINNASTLVINTNGGGVTITIASNTAFFGQVSPLPSGGGGSPLDVADALGTITSNTTKITFTNAVVIPTSPTEASVTTIGGGVTSVGGTLPIASSGGATPTISIADAVADGTTKGAATFVANDFTASSGLIGIDYTNGQSASASAKGFLTSANWTTFNNKSEVVQASNTGGVVVATAVNFRFKTTEFTTTNGGSGIADIELVQLPQSFASGQPPSLTRVAPSTANTIFTAGTKLLTPQLYDDGFDYNPLTGDWTCPVTGRYNISFWAHYSAGIGASWLSGMFTAGLMNGATTGQYCGAWASVTQSTPHIDVSGTLLGVEFTAGQTLCMVVLNQLDSNYSSLSGDGVKFSVQQVR